MGVHGLRMHIVLLPLLFTQWKRNLSKELNALVVIVNRMYEFMKFRVEFYSTFLFIFCGSGQVFCGLGNRLFIHFKGAIF